VAKNIKVVRDKDKKHFISDVGINDKGITTFSFEKRKFEYLEPKIKK